MTGLSNEIGGSASRQAVDSLRGYQYQILASAVAWIALRPDEALFLEVAEDYAIATNTAIVGNQVKDNLASLTLNSESVAETINSLFELQRLNPSKSISLRYLTTSCAGVENAKADRIAGEGGISYWKKASIAAEIAPLRARLLALSLSDEAKAFISSSDDDTLREGLIRRINWDCGQAEIAQVVRTASDGLAGLARLLLCVNRYVTVSLSTDMLGDLRDAAGT